MNSPNEELTDEQKIKMAKKEYYRRWREKNKRRMQIRQRNYWLRKFEEMRQKNESEEQN